MRQMIQSCLLIAGLVLPSTGIAAGAQQMPSTAEMRQLARAYDALEADRFSEAATLYEEVRRSSTSNGTTSAAIFGRFLTALLQTRPGASERELIALKVNGLKYVERSLGGGKPGGAHVDYALSLAKRLMGEQAEARLHFSDAVSADAEFARLDERRPAPPAPEPVVPQVQTRPLLSSTVPNAAVPAPSRREPVARVVPHGPFVRWANRNVNIRSGPTTSAAKLGGLSRGTQVMETGSVPGTPWRQIRFGGRVAFVHSAYLSEAPPRAVPVPSRAGPAQSQGQFAEQRPPGSGAPAPGAAPPPPSSAAALEEETPVPPENRFFNSAERGGGDGGGD